MKSKQVLIFAMDLRLRYMKKENILLWGLVLLFAVLMSLPFLIPGAGFVALFGFVPLLCMDRIASLTGKRHVWRHHYTAFVLWNAFTTFWVCNATVGGGIFATLANALQMSVVFGLFRLSKKRFSGSLPYIFLAAAWIAWERFYFDAEISWPWLVLGNSFARTTWAVQWYEFTGALGGSLWIWACNLLLFGLLVRLSDGSWNTMNRKAKAAYAAGYAALLIVPAVTSVFIGSRYEGAMESRESLPVAILQPNIDPYNKFQAMTQQQQNGILLSMASEAMQKIQAGDTTEGETGRLLLVAPETFTNDITVGQYRSSRTWNSFVSFLSDKPGASLLFGASTWDRTESAAAPSATARRLADGTWIESHNSALITDGSGRTEIFHKSKLVVAVEKTPYPALFCKIDDLLGGVMGRCVGQDEISLLHVSGHGDGQEAAEIPIGCAVCYESVYGEYYTGYVRKGARAMTVITNDAWWGDTPGYRQHLSYSCLRAIETRRAIARCANTGISAIISPSGKIICSTGWWEPAILTGSLPLRDDMTFFVTHGDIAGRVCTFLFCLLLLALAVRFITRK